jgi:hypothetical protein
MKTTKRRIRFIKGSKYKEVIPSSKISVLSKLRKRNLLSVDKALNTKNKFEITKADLIYSTSTNYFLEYWKMYYENEYILAKIKEIVYEIDSMRAHVDELNNK